MGTICNQFLQIWDWKGSPLAHTMYGLEQIGQRPIDWPFYGEFLIEWMWHLRYWLLLGETYRLLWKTLNWKKLSCWLSPPSNKRAKTTKIVEPLKLSNSNMSIRILQPIIMLRTQISYQQLQGTPSLCLLPQLHKHLTFLLHQPGVNKQNILFLIQIWTILFNINMGKKRSW